MRIARADLASYEIPFVRPYVTSYGVRHERRGVVLRLVADDGTVGLGESAPLGARTESFGDTVRALEAVCSRLALAKVSVEEALTDPELFAPELRSVRAARFALVEALMDMLARRQGVALGPWLAGRYAGRAAARDVPVNATIPAHAAEETVAGSVAAVGEGFRTLKLKVGADKAGDAARIAAVRDAVGPGIALRLDANQGFPRDAALAFAEAVDGLGIEYIEQPVSADDAKGLAWLRARTPVPIAADEPVRDLASARELLALQAADVYVVKPMVLGGPDRAIAVAQLVEDAGLDVVITCTIEACIGRAGALHTAAALGTRRLACGLATAKLLRGDVARAPERIEKGHMLVPAAPGLGIEFDEGAGAGARGRVGARGSGEGVVGT